MADQLSNQLKSFKEYMFGTNRDVDNHPLDYGYLLYCVRFTQSHGIYPMSSGSYPDIHRENDSPCPLLNPGYWNESFALNHQDVDPSESDSQCPDPYTSSTFAETYHTRHGHNRDNHLSPYLDTTATDLDYSEHEDNFSISEDDDESASHDYYPPDLDFSRHDDNSFMSNDDDRRVNPDYPPDSQYPASDPVGYDPTTQPLSDDMHATPAPISLSDDLHSAPVRTKLQRKAKLPGKEKLPGKVNLSKKVLQPRHPSSTNGIGDKFLAVLHNYDPLWAQNDRSSVLAFRSKMKFEELFLDGVIRKGDKLVINYSHVFLEDFDNEVATLTHTGFSKPNPLPKNNSARFFPDFTLTLSSHPSYTQPILACNGNNAILSAFDKIHIGGPEIVSSLAGSLQVWQDGLHLGSFVYVRQAWHTWKNRMDAETLGKGMSWRRRKGDPRKAVGVGKWSGRRGKA